MDKMDRNKLWSFVEEEESTVERRYLDLSVATDDLQYLAGD